MKVHHLNCGILHAPPGPAAACHCLLLDLGSRLVLVETGIGLRDIENPLERIGAEAIAAAGFQFREELSAVRQIKNPARLTDIVLTHADPDHVGGLADFPNARVHLSLEEHNHLNHPRYSPAQFQHQPRWVLHPPSNLRWFGLEARPLQLGSDLDLLLVPLFGHTLGHCGVAIRRAQSWLLHVGDAYYLRAELDHDPHPVSQLAAQRADDDRLRRASLSELRRLAREHADQIDLLGYHDFSEFPARPAEA